MAKNYLRFAVWNIEGLSCKLNDIDFISKLENFDLISLVETWLPYGQNNINIDGFFSFSKNRKDISQNSRRSSGGITILVKSSLRKGVKFLDKESTEEFVWWKLDKTFFKLPHDIFICTVYIPPQYSSRETRINIDHFESLQNSIDKFTMLGKVVLCGDFNARTGVL
jgi:exonuclease III